MKVFIVFDSDQDAGTSVFHIASSMEKAEEWRDRFYEKFYNVGIRSVYHLEIEEVEVDQEEELSL